MDIGALVTAGVVGNFSYDIVKSFANVSVQFLKYKIANTPYSWGVDDATIQHIANRINELSYNEGESKDDYCERLKNDRHLTSLFEASTLNYTQHNSSGPNAVHQSHSGTGNVIGNQYNINKEAPPVAKK